MSAFQVAKFWSKPELSLSSFTIIGEFSHKFSFLFFFQNYLNNKGKGNMEEQSTFTSSKDSEMTFYPPLVDTFFA